MPGAVPITSTYALTNATLPYVLAHRQPRRRRGAARRPGPASRASTSPAGKITYAPVAEAVGLPYVDPDEALAAGAAA